MNQKQTGQAGWWPALLDEWTDQLIVAEPGNYAEHLTDYAGGFLTCDRWTNMAGIFGRPGMSLSKQTLNVVHGLPGSGKSAAIQALTAGLCDSGTEPELTGCVLTGTDQTWNAWISRMAGYEQGIGSADIHILSSVNIWTDQGLTLLMEHLTDQKSDILVVDNLNDFLPPGQTSHQAWTSLYRCLNIISRQAGQQSGKHIVQAGTVVETEPALLTAGEYEAWNQTGLTLRVMLSEDIPGAEPTAERFDEPFSVLYPTVGGENRDDIPVRAVKIRQGIRFVISGRKPLEYYYFGGRLPTKGLDIPGLDTSWIKKQR